MKRGMIGLAISLVMAGVVLVCLVVLTPGSAGATKPAVSPGSSESAVTITYWHPYSGDREALMQRMVNEFNTTNPYSITVQAVYMGSYGDIYDSVIAGLRSTGSLPNVVVAYPNSFADFARFGAVRFLDDYLVDNVVGITDTSDFHPGLLDYYRLEEYGNQLAGLQYGRSIELMYYNADLLAGVGTTVPTTWDAFESTCISLTTETVSGTILSLDASRFATWLWSRGGELLSSDHNHARFQEQPGIESLLLFQGLIDSGHARLERGSYEAMGAFGNGRVGFTFGSSGALPYYHSSMEAGANHAWGVTHVPAVPGNEVVDSYGGGAGVLHKTEDEDLAAWFFIRWLTEREQTARWAALSGYFPVRLSAETHISVTQKLAEDEQYAQALSLLPLGRSEPGIRGYDEMRHIINDAMVAILQDGANVTDTLQAASVQVDLLLANSGPDSDVIYPSGGMLVYTDTQGLSTTVEFPSGAIEFTQTVSYVPLDDLPTDGLAFALVPNMEFSQPVTITIYYRDSDVIGMDEDLLQLYIYDWSAGSWVDADPCGGYIRDADNKILQAVVCHFTDYALMDPPSYIYLPLVVRN